MKATINDQRFDWKKIPDLGEEDRRKWIKNTFLEENPKKKIMQFHTGD